MSAVDEKQALKILKELRDHGNSALELVPTQEDLPSTLVYLSDVAAVQRPHLTDASETCRHAENIEAFMAEALPMKEMGQFGLHLILCMKCRSQLSAKGVRPFQRSTELLRHVLGRIKTKP